MKMLKKKITALVCALIISATSSAFAYTPLDKDFHTPTSQEELDYTYNQYFDEVKQAHKNDIQKNAYLESIRDKLVKYNSDKLKLATNKRSGDGLRDVYITDENMNAPKEDGEQFSGFVTIEAPVLKFVSEETATKDYNIYAQSTTASVYAHEASHWFYEDGWTHSNQNTLTNADTFKIEARADKLAIKLLENVPSFSVGGVMSNYYHNAYYDGWYNKTSTHASNANRFDEAYNYIVSSSKERVLFDNNTRATNELLVANKDKSAYYTVYPQEQVLNSKKVASSIDRANYVAGQIAWAIKNNVWDSKHITFEDAHKYFADLPSNISATVIIAKANNGNYKIIDWYQNDKADTTEKEYLDNLKASYKS